MFKSLLILVTFSSLPLAQADGYDSALCNGSYRCGGESISSDNRARPTIKQEIPNTDTLGSCGKNLPRESTYQVSINGVTCGEGADAKDRVPVTVDEKKMEHWDTLFNSGKTSSREEMQALRNMELDWENTIEFPMWEHWTYQERVGDFKSTCNGRDNTEGYWTTCSRSREEKYQHDVTDTSNCLAYYPETSSSDSGYSGGGGGGSKPSRPSAAHDTYVPKASMPKAASQSGGSKSTFNRRPKSIPTSYHPIKSNQDQRHPAASCKTYGTKRVWDWRPTSGISYQCYQTRNKWCEWHKSTEMSQRCTNHSAKYSLSYDHDSKWRPDYIDPSGDKKRDYMDLLPNKFDLLPGETEEIVVYANIGVKSNLNPDVVIKDGWNEYSKSISPSSFKCEFGMKPEFKVKIITDGRIMRNTPNILDVPVNENGEPGQPFEFEDVGSSGEAVQVKPVKLTLQDAGRATQLRASKLSRIYPRPDGASANETDAIHKRSATPQKAYSTMKKFFAENQLKIQITRVGRFGKEVVVTRPTTFSSQQTEVFDDSMTVDLVGRMGVENTYKAAGPFDRVLGFVWDFLGGVQFTPDTTYNLKVWVVQRGLPFYNSGCEDGSNACQGEKMDNDKVWSTPRLVPWTPNADNRSLLKRLKDFQNKFRIY